jgi:tetratricopeptide (TPR) repeat protein
MARRTDEADSLARTWSSNYPAVADDAEDIEILALREHGQFRASIRRSLASHDTLGSDALNLEVVDAYGRLGEYDNAEQYWKRRVVSAAATQAFRTGPHGDGARWFTWTRANEGNAIAGAKDTLKLHALVDSLRRISPLSYYGRDWRLYNHLLGIIAMTAHRYAEAEHDFQAARWGTAGWTVTVAWLARAQLAQGHATAAISSLRDAYQAAPDAMGRYEPRSELDYLMALSFQKAGMPDSARVYGDYVRQAWRNADPEIKSQLAALTPAAVRQ